jgi:broad specificity phosphatase PhoE
MPLVRYLTHPQVLIDPAVEVPQWPLNDQGQARVAQLAQTLGVLRGTTHVTSSDEVKALETARPLA